MLSTKIILGRFFTIRQTRPTHGLLPRTIHGSCIAHRQPNAQNPVSHSVESYFVDSDDTPPSNPSIYKVDATSDAAESAYEPPSGQWSRAVAGTEEFDKDKGPELSKAGEGPEGTERRGRKPEGKA